MQNLLKGMTGGKQGRASFFFHYVITKDRAATFSDIEIFL
jgi:hypothetical protein